MFAAVKLYPADATTNSAHGVTDIDRVMPVLERMAAIGMPLLIHGEVTDPEVDIFDREAVFIDRVLDPLRADCPSCASCSSMSRPRRRSPMSSRAAPNSAATITAHHLVINRNAIFVGGIRPHLYCLPIAKREKHRLALRRAATSGNPRSFSAPTARRTRPDQGDRLRLRRHLHRAGGAGDLRRSLRGGRRARPLRGLRLAERPGLLPPAGERDPDDAAARSVDRAGADRRRRACRHAVPRPARRCAGGCGPKRRSGGIAPAGLIGGKGLAMSP